MGRKWVHHRGMTSVTRVATFSNMMVNTVCHTIGPLKATHTAYLPLSTPTSVSWNRFEKSMKNWTQ